jgi:PAS domain S-box-containing protein
MAPGEDFLDSIQRVLGAGTFAGRGEEVWLAALDAVPNPVFVKDSEARFIFFNRAYQTAFGISREKYLGKTVLALDYIPEEGRESFHSEDRLLIAEGGSMHRELNIQYADGTDRTVLYWVTAFELGGQTERGLLGMLVDVSDEAALRQELKSALRRSSPISRITEDVLLLPVTGIVDDLRGRQLQEDALSAIEAARARVLIVDIGGLAVMNATVAQVLVRLSRSTALMGCRSLISGVSPQVALGLVALLQGDTQLNTVGTLRDALKAAGLG